jgi:hypothetical protein
VLEAYALIRYHVPRSELAAVLHQRQHLATAQRRLSHFMRDLIADAVEAGTVRDDIPGDELVHYCLHALEAANTMPSKTAVHRLVAITLTGMRPDTASGERRASHRAFRSVGLLGQIRSGWTSTAPRPRTTAIQSRH